MSEGKRYPLKIVIVGDAAVGKTSLIRRLADNKFEDAYTHTIGADFNVKVVEFPEHKKNAVLTLWDIGGQERFDLIRGYYYEGSHAGLIVFDLTKKESFKNVSNWHHDLQSYLKNIPIALIGNKNDLESQIIISDNDIESKMNELKIDFSIKTSAKTGENVEDVFSKLAKMVLEKFT